MAGTDSSRGMSDTVTTKVAPKMLLVRPQLAENVGMVARAMLNCGLSDLRIVDPREDHLAPKAISASSGAHVVLEQADLFDSTRKAVADANFVLATTARRREQVKPVMTPRRAAAEVRARIDRGETVVILFGQERTGLDNDDVSIADAICEVPLNPAYCSLNLAQAVLLMGYEWFQSGVDVPDYELTLNDTFPATRDEVLNLYAHMERELELCGFLRVEEKRPTMVRNLRSLYNRAQLTDQDVRTLHGMLTELSHGNIRRARKLGIDVAALRSSTPSPMPLYTSQPLFDSTFRDTLNALVLADDRQSIVTDDTVPMEAVDQILEVAFAEASEAFGCRRLPQEGGDIKLLLTCADQVVPERELGGILQTIRLLARARGLVLTELDGAESFVSDGQVPVAFLSIAKPQAEPPDMQAMIAKGRKI